MCAAVVAVVEAGCGASPSPQASAAPPATSAAPTPASVAAPSATPASTAASAPVAGAPPPATPTPQRSLIALSKGDHTLAIVDPADLHVVARAPVGPDPHEVIASSDGRTAFVSNTGGGRFHELDVIDLVAQRALPSVDTGALLGPHGLTFVAGKVWLTAEGAKAVARFDPATARFDWILGTGQNRTHMLYVTADEKRVYTTNVDSGSVSLLESVMRAPPGPSPGMGPPHGATGGPPPPPPGMGPADGHPPEPRPDWEETVVPLARGVEGFDVSPNGRELWTVSAQDGKVSIIDLESKKVTSVLDAHALGANRLKLTPDGKLALISTMMAGELIVYDAASHKEMKRIHIGRGGAGLLVDANSTRAFVSCTASDYVAVVDLRKLDVTTHIDVGAKPDGLAWAIRP
jgi:DNA-binding beta-propeller fold protein YncE